MAHDDGSAFQAAPYNTVISLRDYFAGQAHAGMLASPPFIDRASANVHHAGWAKNAYLFADAMLKARAK